MFNQRTWRALDALGGGSLRLLPVQVTRTMAGLHLGPCERSSGPRFSLLVGEVDEPLCSSCANSLLIEAVRNLVKMDANIKRTRQRYQHASGVARIQALVEYRDALELVVDRSWSYGSSADKALEEASDRLDELSQRELGALEPVERSLVGQAGRDLVHEYVAVLQAATWENDRERSWKFEHELIRVWKRQRSRGTDPEQVARHLGQVASANSPRRRETFARGVELANLLESHLQEVQRDLWRLAVVKVPHSRVLCRALVLPFTLASHALRSGATFTLAALPSTVLDAIESCGGQLESSATLGAADTSEVLETAGVLWDPRGELDDAGRVLRSARNLA